jgi:hypothetical protein
MVRNSVTLFLVIIKEKTDPGSRWVEVSQCSGIQSVMSYRYWELLGFTFSRSDILI